MKRFTRFFGLMFSLIFIAACSYEGGDIFHVVEDESLYFNDTIVSIFGPDTIRLSPHQYQREAEMPFSYYLLRAFSIRQANIPSGYVGFPNPQTLYFAVMDTLRGGHFTYYIPHTFVYDYLKGFELPEVVHFGFQLRAYNDTVFIAKIFNNTPAHNAGLRKGDKILRANNFPIYGNIDVFNAATGAAGVDHTIVYMRDGVIDSTSARRERIILPVSYSDSLSESVGYIHISTFIASMGAHGGSTAEQFMRSLNETSHFPITVIDLRNNGGGYISQAYEVINMFLSAGDTLLIERGRHPTQSGAMGENYENVIIAHSNGVVRDRDFVFLVNVNSASGTELLVAAVTHNRDIPVVGTRTFGKAIGQSSVHGKNGGMAHITSIEFFNPDGSSFSHVGISPDYEVLFAISNFEDEMLVRATEVAESRLVSGGYLAKRSSQSLRDDEDFMENVSRINAVYGERKPIMGFPGMGFIKLDFDL